MEKETNKAMEKGISQILGYTPFVNKPVEPTCNHQDDGFEYGTTARNVILKCSICKEYYEVPNNQ